MINAVYESEMVRVKTPDGMLYLLIMENKDKTIAGFRITIGKAGAPIAAWTYALSEMMNLALKQGASLDDIINTLRDITSDRVAYTMTTPCRSGPEGVWQALMRYRQGGPTVDHTDLDEKSVRGASVAPWARQRRK